MCPNTEKLNSGELRTEQKSETAAAYAAPPTLASALAPQMPGLAMSSDGLQPDSSGSESYVWAFIA